MACVGNRCRRLFSEIKASRACSCCCNERSRDACRRTSHRCHLRAMLPPRVLRRECEHMTSWEAGRSLGHIITGTRAAGPTRRCSRKTATESSNHRAAAARTASTSIMHDRPSTIVLFLLGMIIQQATGFASTCERKRQATATASRRKRGETQSHKAANVATDPPACSIRGRHHPKLLSCPSPFSSLLLPSPAFPCALHRDRRRVQQQQLG